MAESERRQFVKFNFFKVAPEWRFLSEQERADGKRELSAVVDECSTHMFIRSFSMVGIRGDADFLLWQACDTLEELQDMMTSVYKTQMGRYLQQPYSYLAMTRRSQYVGEHRHEGQEGTSVRIRPGEAKYFVVYPFLKTRDWYVLPSEERQRMMMTHINTGHKYPSVKINTTYSFGLDDQEFVVAFETDELSDFLHLVEELRSVPVGQFTEREIPIFTSILMPVREALETLGD